ncbi:hypothetical protein BGZ95_000834 [Linnemannia exigua]|uniref:Uncharacterized protein n=1 Tax=Linnemannia exigua TaxID=604196 RepID=A0AAD4D7P2_9FUNG|nr:hypothetical protein BGZ95_000834 [Linnemannia exigua]
MSKTTDKHNGQPPPPVQRLPNECLYLIVNHLLDDLPTLHTLLSVNRFFFHAAIPKIMMDQPLDTWSMNTCDAKFPTNSEKLFVLVLASLLHYQRQNTGQDASSILKEYGLQLVPSAEFELLQPFFATVKNDDYSGVKKQQQQQHQEKQENPMTMDYSKFFTILNSYHWQYVDYHRFIRLIEIPESLRVAYEPQLGLDEITEQPSASEPTTQEQDDYTITMQEDREYVILVREAIAQMMLRYNVDSITEFSLHVSEARKYLPMAAKLAKLKVLVLYRDDSLPDQHLQDTITFIQFHKSTFPGKPCLQLRFDHRWNGYDTKVFNTIKESRTSRFNKMKSKLELYRAIREPEELDIGDIPGFYGMAGDISTERLLRLDDEDQFRTDMGEGADMEAFLRRCHRLDTLRMDVGHPHIFSWAAQHARDYADGHAGYGRAISTGILPRLYDLYLWSDRPYRFSIHALNDSMVAFSKSLGRVVISNNHEFRSRGQNTNPWYPWVLEKDDERSRMIRNSPLANKVGDWPFPFPKLTSLRIDLRCTSHIQIEAPRAVGPNDDDPTADPRRQAPLDPSLYPKWTLPRLKTLHLDGAPALLFDYDSLEGMPNLETMTLSCRKKVDMDERLKDIPRLSLHTSSFCSTFASQETTLTDNSDSPAAVTSEESAKSTSTSSKSTIWTRTWTLPKLKTLELDGPPATVFTFDWLKGCPSLKSVSLSLHLYGSPQRLPLIAHSPAAYALSPPTKESNTKSLHNNIQDTTTAVAANTDTGVFVKSSLESLHLKGPWEITASDLTVLVTDNAPFLKTLTMNKVQTREGMSVTDFVQAFKDADNICRQRYGEDWDALPGDMDIISENDGDDDEAPQEDLETANLAGRKDDADVSADSQASAVGASTDTLPARSPLPGRSLLSIETNYTIGKRLRSLTELENIDSDDAEDYRRCGIRVYVFSKQCLVDKYDKAWYTRNRGSEWWTTIFQKKN